jgi:hypothetical protein
LASWRRHWRRVLLMASIIMLLILRPTYRKPKPLLSMEWLGEPAPINQLNPDLMKGVPMSNVPVFAASAAAKHEAADSAPSAAFTLDAAASGPGTLYILAGRYDGGARVLRITTSRASPSYFSGGVGSRNWSLIYTLPAT